MKELTSKKLTMMLVAQSEAIPRDVKERRGLAWQVVAEVTMIPDDALPDDVARVAQMASDYVNYAYGNEPRPEWVRSEWFSEDW